jgi:hypothetical protein
LTAGDSSRWSPKAADAFGSNASMLLSAPTPPRSRRGVTGPGEGA